VGAVAGLVFEGAAYLCYGGVVARALKEDRELELEAHKGRSVMREKQRKTELGKTYDSFGDRSSDGGCRRVLSGRLGLDGCGCGERDEESGGTHLVCLM